MSTTNNNSEKREPQPTLSRSTTIIALFVVAIELVIGVVAYPFLPAIVPTHWDAAGHVNGYGPKWVNLFLLPLINIGIYLLIRVLMAAGPHLAQQSKRVNTSILSLIVTGLSLFFLVLQLTLIAASLKIPVDITLMMSLALSALFIFIGNYLGKLRRNFWGGIRTPWTLASDTVWERTHRLGGWLYVAAGVISLPLSFVPGIRLFALVALIIAASLISAAYSYFAYQKYVLQGNNPLSPPFDDGSRV